MMKLLLAVIASALTLIMASCGPDTRDRENYGDLSTPPGAIVLTSQAQHPHGWGRRDCIQCHNIFLNVHRRPGNGLIVQDLNQKIINGGGSTYCLTCHGSNGLY